MKALVVGGTGPTGPYIIEGLQKRGYELTLYHRGVHEPDDLPEVDHHLHGDPFDLETLQKEITGFKYRYYHTCSARKGYSGTAIWCKQKPLKTTFGLGQFEENK